MGEINVAPYIAHKYAHNALRDEVWSWNIPTNDQQAEVDMEKRFKHAFTNLKFPQLKTITLIYNSLFRRIDDVIYS